MANIRKTLILLSQLEYSNMPSLFLHKNSGESGYTCGGVYRTANPDAIDWDFVDNIVKACDKNIKRASVMLHADRILQKQIEEFSKQEIWDKMKLDHVISQKIADEMFCFAFHTHWKTAAKIAQKVIGVKEDGYIGEISLKALNSFDIDKFDMIFDEKEDAHYSKLIKRRPYLQTNYIGWKNRAYEI